jgi:hypothetical protein
MKRSTGILLTLLVLGTAPALAQNYVITSSQQTYAPLTGTGVTTLVLTNSGVYDVRDEGFGSINLGFTFPYYGVNHTAIGVNANGVLTLGATATSACNYSSGSVICTNVGNFPSTTSPTSVIAPWNADLDGSPTGVIRWVKPSPSEIVIEFNDWGYYSDNGRFSFQVRLNASGLFQVHYGAYVGTGSFTSAGAGFKDHTGTQGAGLPACGANRSCNASTWPTNTLYTVGQPVQADLYVDQVDINNINKVGSDLEITLTPTFRNFGQTAANNFHWKAYLSTDRNSLAGALLFYDSSTATGGQTASVAPISTSTAQGTGTAVNVPPGNYYVLVEADSTNVVTEFSETNNVGATVNYFTQGFDMVAVGVNGPSQSGPGNNIAINVSWQNQGTDPSGAPVRFRLYLSLDTNLDGNDFVAHEWTLSSVGGGQSATNAPQNFVVPQNVPGGDFHWILQVNAPPNPVVEASFANNTVASASKIKIFQADLEILAADVLNTSGQPTRQVFLGETAKVRAQFRNVGGANANNFHIGVALSKDANLSLLPGGDFIFFDHPVAQSQAGAPTQDVTFDVTIPLVDKAMNPIPSGSYFVFVILDSFNVLTELSKGNNTKVVGSPAAEAINMLAPAPDYTVIKIDVPAAGAVGEVMPLYRVIKNIGNQAGPQVQYRYYASANEIITTSDVALPILSSTGAVLDAGEVTLGAGASDARTDLVLIPASLVPGTWFMGVVVDVGNVAVEHNKANNAVAAPTTVQVVPSSMVITNQQLPDATAGMPYAFKLSATGQQEGQVWSADGTLPPGVSLTPAGVLSGTPGTTGVFTFTARVKNGNSEAAARLVMRVLSASPELIITTSALPPVINSTSLLYRANLSAVGGAAPYAWKLLSGVLPNGLVLAKDGTIEGTLKPGVAFGETPLLVEVADTLGNRAKAQIRIKVVEAGALVITSIVLPETMVNAEYLADVAARNADQSPLAKPLTWKVAAGRLPEGMALTVAQDELGLLTGRPLESGHFAFSVQVTDAKGRSDVSDFILRVHPARSRLSAVNPPGVLRPGDEVSYQITTGNAQSRYRIYSGALPPGLTLDENGQVTGTVTEEALGTWNFVVEASAAATGSSLGAFALEVQPHPVTAGCSATSGGTGRGWLLLAAPLLALFGRRRAARGLAVAGVAALALLPSQAAFAQSYVQAPPSPVTYQPLAGGTPITNSVTTTTGLNQVSLPFDFEFYGEVHKQLGISLHGYVAFDSLTGSGANQVIPHNSTSTTVPKKFIALWWDAMNKTTTSPATVVKHGTVGTAPNRTFVVDWQNLCPTSSCSTPRLSVQLQLSESTHRIRMIYGPVVGSWTGSASAGIQRQNTIGQAALTCGASCSTLNFPSGQAIDLSTLADLQIKSLSVDDTGYVGVPFQAAAVVSNKGGIKASMVRVRYWLSTDATLQPASDVLLGTSSAGDVDPGQDATLLANLTIPSGTTTGSYFLLSRVDPDNTVTETKENNNDGTPLQFTVGPPTPDLTVHAISSTPQQGAPGAMLSVTRELRNLGNASSGAFPVTYFVSDNSVVSISDIQIHKESAASIGGAMGATPGSNTQTLSMPLPGNLPAGQYWIGACADYDSAANPTSVVTEISEVNNCATGNSFIVNTGALTITTSTLPQATQNSPYGQQLQAIGGDGTYAWTLGGGALPPGMSLGTQGHLTGSPSVAGTFTFTARVVSAGTDATKQLSLTVVGKNLPLAIADHQLPSAQFGQAYGFQLVAVGGNPPYRWTLAGASKLPQGLNLSPDGYIEGRNTSTSEVPVTFTVEVEDRDGARAAKTLQILVTKPGSLQIATSKLPVAYLDESYNASLAAVGGSGTYAWSVVSFQQLAQSPVDVPGGEKAKLPDGFGIVQQGASLAGVPRVAGLFALTFRVFDPNAGTEDITTLPLLVSYKRPLSIVTTVLPDAYVGQPYNVRLTHNADPSKVSVVWSETCVQQAQATSSGIVYSCMAADASQKLPEGLVLGPDGALSGTPTTPVPEAAEGAETNYPIHSFLVKVEDDKGRADVRSLSVRVRPARVVDAGGCSGTGLGPAALALLALGGLWRRRNRK